MAAAPENGDEGRQGGLAVRRTQVRALVLLAGGVLVAGLVWLGMALAGVPLPGPGFTVEAARQAMEEAGPAGVAAVIGLMVLHCFIPFPAEIVALAAGMVFGPVKGAMVTWIGAMIGAILSFAVARWLGRPAVEIFLSGRHREQLDAWTRNQGAASLLVARLIPVIAFNLVNYAAGLTNMRWRTYVLVTSVGILPLTILMVWMGWRMEDLEAWHWVLLFTAATALWLGLRVRRRYVDTGGN